MSATNIVPRDEHPTEEPSSPLLPQNNRNDQQCPFSDPPQLKPSPYDNLRLQSNSASINNGISQANPQTYQQNQLGQQHQWDPVSTAAPSQSRLSAPPLDQLDFDSQLHHKEPPPQYETEYPQPQVQSEPYQNINHSSALSTTPSASVHYLSIQEHPVQNQSPLNSGQSSAVQPQTTTEVIFFPVLRPKPIPGLREYQAQHRNQQRDEALRLQQTPNLSPEQQQQQRQQQQQQQPEPEGFQPRTQPNQKALCGKCSEPYRLPAGATSWRCKKCGEFQNIGPRDCTIL